MPTHHSHPPHTLALVLPSFGLWSKYSVYILKNRLFFFPHSETMNGPCDATHTMRHLHKENVGLRLSQFTHTHTTVVGAYSLWKSKQTSMFLFLFDLISLRRRRRWRLTGHRCFWGMFRMSMMMQE